MQFSPEQQQVILHPPGQHARVMAVAGSGKTRTMAGRIKFLVEHQGIDPKNILVLMYNALARQEFKERLEQLEVPEPLRPPVHTFHSYTFGFINKMIKQGLMPPFVSWTDDGKVHQVIHLALRNLGLKGQLDPEEVEGAISLWKGSLIPPQRAGCHSKPELPKAYAEFERLRAAEEGLTFDDFVPVAVGMLESQSAAARESCSSVDFLIVDEYQDVNYGQQRLIELVAGDRADVTVVGDDDQTIYEWRGARPSYIIREFKEAFANKPHVEYKLTRSFRFGPVIAQAAQNVIGFNSNRVPKDLVADKPRTVSQIVFVTEGANQPIDVDKELTDQVEFLLHQEQIEPTQIVVLARMFVQLSGLEAEFSMRRIPYHVLGAKPFFERREVRTLLDYVRVAVELDEPMTKARGDRFLLIANMPSRMLKKSLLQTVVQHALLARSSMAAVLTHLAEDPQSPLNKQQTARVVELHSVLRQAGERVISGHDVSAGDFLRWLVKALAYEHQFDDYYGKGEESAERKLAVSSLVDYADKTVLAPLDFIEHVEGFDPTQGLPEDQQIRMTTIFKTKGLEYDYVFIPHCEEGYMPCLHRSDLAVFDTEGVVREPEASEAIENERRLFYVGITRARNTVFVGASTNPQKGHLAKPMQPSRFLEEVQLESVNDILPALQRLVNEDWSGRQHFLDGVRQWAGCRWVKQNLVDSYIARLGDAELSGCVATLIGAVPEQPFAYKLAYATTKVVPSKRLEWKLKPPSWLTEQAAF